VLSLLFLIFPFVLKKYLSSNADFNYPKSKRWSAHTAQLCAPSTSKETKSGQICRADNSTYPLTTTQLFRQQKVIAKVQNYIRWFSHNLDARLYSVARQRQKKTELQFNNQAGDIKKRINHDLPVGYTSTSIVTFYNVTEAECNQTSKTELYNSCHANVNPAG
jgi:gas vesicle protein